MTTVTTTETKLEAIEISEGANFTMTVNVGEDITGHTITMTGKIDVDAGALFTWSTATGEIVITDAANGIYQVQADSTDTASLAFTTGVYDILRDAGGGDKYRDVQGPMTYSPKVT